MMEHATMSEINKIPSIEEAKAYIDSIDFSQIIDKMVMKDKWKKRDAEKACELYKHFLYLKKKYQSSDDHLPPSEEIDEFWHNHILDTKKYMIDCDRIFGRYLHHYPYLGIDDKTDMNDLQRFFEKTQELHYREFGDYIYNVRKRPLKQLQTFVKSLIK